MLTLAFFQRLARPSADGKIRIYLGKDIGGQRTGHGQKVPLK